MLVWSIIILNVVVWLGNAAISSSNDRSGSGMVLMLTIPLSILFSLLSLIFIGFLT